MSTGGVGREGPRGGEYRGVCGGERAGGGEYRGVGRGGTQRG